MLFACCCRWTVKQKRKQNQEEDFLLFRIASSTGCSTQRPGRPPPHRSGNPLRLKYDPSQLSRSITERRRRPCGITSLVSGFPMTPKNMPLARPVHVFSIWALIPTGIINFWQTSPKGFVVLESLLPTALGRYLLAPL